MIAANVWLLSPLVKQTFMNINHIHPLKQHRLGAFLDEVEKYPEIKRVVVFGSSTSEACTEFSDVDVLLFGGFGSKFVPPSNDEYDILYAERLPKEASIWNEIRRDGVVIYEA